MIKPISISLSPNTEKDDISLALKLIFKPWQWTPPTRHLISINRQNQHKSAAIELEEEFKKYLGVKYTISFNSGRSALMAILNSLDLEKGSEVLLQAFTCNAAVNPIIWAGLKPVYVDCDDGSAGASTEPSRMSSPFNIDIEDLKRTLRQAQDKRPKVLMVQHTFGLPANIDEISEICQKYNLILIEDCAHSLGAEYKGKKVGTFGNASFFSFSRDKVISSVFGGMAVTNDERIAERIKKFREELNYPSNFWILQQLLHPILMNWLILPGYGLNQYLGRIVLGFFHKISILSKTVYKKEKRGERVKYFPKKLPNALALLALTQFRKLERFNRHRREIAEFYKRNLKNRFFSPFLKKDKDRTPVFMRYPVLMDYDTNDVLKKARKRKFFLDDGWRKSPIVSLDTDLKKMNYNLGSCPKAEKIANSIVNLPTHINISLEDAKKIVDFLRLWK